MLALPAFKIVRLSDIDKQAGDWINDGVCGVYGPSSMVPARRSASL